MHHATDIQKHGLRTNIHLKYFDLVYSDRRGEKVFCITLLEKGKSYFRKEKIERQNLVKRFFLTIGFAVLSFLVGVILRKIF